MEVVTSETTPTENLPSLFSLRFRKSGSRNDSSKVYTEETPRSNVDCPDTTEFMTVLLETIDYNSEK